MNSDNVARRITRREMIQSTGVLAGGWALSQAFSGLVAAATASAAQMSPEAAAAAMAQARARFGNVPIESTKLSDNLTLLTGPGGNVVALRGPERKRLSIISERLR